MPPSPSALALLNDVDLTVAALLEGAQAHLDGRAFVGLGPCNAEAQRAMRQVALEVANACACCCSRQSGDEQASRARLIAAAADPWGAWALRVLRHSALSSLEPSVRLSAWLSTGEATDAA